MRGQQFLGYARYDSKFIVQFCCKFIPFQPQQFVIENVHDTFEPDALTTSHAIQLPVYHPDEIGEIFDRISYGKVHGL